MRRLLALLVATLVVAGCSNPSSTDAGKLDVVTAFYPLQFLSERIGGDAVAVTNLTKPGAEPHDIELTPAQVGQVAEASLAVYLKGFQPAVDEAVAQEAGDRAFDAASAVTLLAASEAEHAHEGEGEAGHEGEEEAGHEGEEETGHAEEAGGTDPHVWLDPVRFATITDKLAERLGQADPAHAADYTARAAGLHTELKKLDTEYRTALKTCERRELVTSHTAFHYLADRYDLTQIGISGISPESEPSPQRLAEVAAEAKEHQTTTIFFETLVSPAVAETIAREVGAKTAVLDPLEGLTEAGGDYFSVMRANLTALTTALGCAS